MSTPSWTLALVALTSLASAAEQTVVIPETEIKTAGGNRRDPIAWLEVDFESPSQKLVTVNLSGWYESPWMPGRVGYQVVAKQPMEGLEYDPSREAIVLKRGGSEIICATVVQNSGFQQLIQGKRSIEMKDCALVIQKSIVRKESRSGVRETPAASVILAY